MLSFDYEYDTTVEGLVANILGSVYPNSGDGFMSFHQDIFLPLPSPHSTNIIQYFIMTLTVVCTEPPAIYQLQFKFCFLALIPMTSACEPVFWEAATPSIYLSVLAILGKLFALCPPLSNRFEKSC